MQSFIQHENLANYRSLLVTTADETVLKKNGSRFCKNAIGHRQQKSLLISAIVGSRRTHG